MDFQVNLTTVPIRYEWLNDLYEQTDQSFCLNRVPVPLNEEFSRRYFHAVQSGMNGGLPFRAWEILADHQSVGKAELTLEEDGKAEVDLILRRTWTGKGIGSQVLELLKREAADWHRCNAIAAYVREDHVIMRHVLEKTGFQSRRRFSADIVTPDEAAYRVTTAFGREYILNLYEAA